MSPGQVVSDTTQIPPNHNLNNSKKNERMMVKIPSNSYLADFIKNEKEKNPDLTYNQILERLVPKDMDDHLMELFDNFRDSVLQSLATDYRGSDAYYQMEALRTLFLKYLVQRQNPKNPDKILKTLEPTQTEDEKED
jgi:hypothetical protein